MSQRVRVCLFLALVALVCSAWWWFGLRQPVAPPSDGAPTEAASEATDPSGPISVSSADDAAAAASERADASSAEARSAGRPLVVQVWLGEVGVAASGAEVFSLPERAARSFDQVEERGLRFVADAEGRATLPPVDAAVSIVARLPGLFGARTVAPGGAASVSVTLEPDKTVTVKVLDAGDAAVAGAPVALNQRVPVVVGMEWIFEEMAALEREIEEVLERMRQSTSEQLRTLLAPDLREMKRQLARLARQASGRRGGRGAASSAAPEAFVVITEELSRRRTNAEGIAVFRHFQLLPRRDSASWPEERRDRFEVALSAPLARPVTRGFSGAEVPDEVLLLRLPDSGRITMRMVDRDGQPFAHPVHVDLYQVDDRGEAVGQPITATKAQGEQALALPFVGLDLAAEAHFRLDDETFHWVEKLRVVEEPGDHLEIDVVVAPDVGMLRGSLQDAAGAPLGGAEIDFAVQAGPVQVEVERLQLDGEGRFHLPYRRGAGIAAPFSLEARHDGRPAQGGTFALVDLPTAAVTDVGALQIGALDALAAGVVVDDAGAPIAGARVQLQRREVVDSSSGAMEFRDEAAARVRTGEDGRFEMFGRREQFRSRLFVKAEEHFPAATRDIETADQDLRVELLRKAQLAGIVLVPEWMHPGYVRVELLPQHVPSLPPGDAAERLGRIEGDLLAFDWLRAGTYSLTFAMKGFRDPFLRLEDVVVQAGQQGLHPELNGLDLSRYVHRFEISAVDENGDSVVVDRPMLARITHADGSRSWMGLAMRGRSSQVFSATPQLEVYPMASGFVADPQVLSPGFNEVVYRRVPPVEIVLPGLYALSSDVDTYVSVEQLDRGALPASLGEGFDNVSNRMSTWYDKSRFSAAELKGDDTARFVLPAGGPHRVSLRLSKDEDKPQFVDLGVVEIDLVPGAETLRITTPYDAEAVRGVIEALREGK